MVSSTFSAVVEVGEPQTRRLRYLERRSIKLSPE